MSELIKTEAIVLRKLDFGDSSRIVHFFTFDYGKMSAIIKGARSPKSRTGAALDTFNYVQIVLYKKENRDIQLVREIDLLNHFSLVKEELDRMQYAQAIVELLSGLTAENEAHTKLFTGTIKALELLNSRASDPKYIFIKYFIFFIKEIGYAIHYDNCSVCGKNLSAEQDLAFNYDSGFVCPECRQDRLVHTEINKELFKLFICLNQKKNDIKYLSRDLDRILQMMTKFLKYNLTEFKGLKSLELI